MVPCKRVSTARQGASGLGLDAQRNATDRFAASGSAGALGRFTEVERGRNPYRPDLTKAIQPARLTGATLIIAKLGRLSRHAAFLLTLRDSGIGFVAVAMPEATDLTAGIMVLVTQAAREAVSGRTKEVMAVARARGEVRQPQWGSGTQAGKGGAAARKVVEDNATRIPDRADCAKASSTDMFATPSAAA